MEKQTIMYDSGNELAAFAAKQINYHVMGYYPITPSTQIAENLDVMGAEGLHDIALIAAERQRAFIRLRTVSGAVRQTHADGHECCMPHGFRPFVHQGRSQRRHVSAQHGLDHPFCR